MNIKNIIKISIIVLLIASLSSAPASADIFSWAKSNLKPMQIVPWLPNQPYVVQANGVYYDTYLTNTYFTDCGLREVVELYNRGANRNMAPTLAYQCVDADSGNGANTLERVGQQLANNYHPPQTPIITPTPGATNTPTIQTPSSPKLQIIPPAISSFFAWIFSVLFGG